MDSTEFQIDGELSRCQLFELEAYCSGHFGDAVAISPRSRMLGVVLEALSAISGVVQAVAAVIALCLQIKQSKEAKDWSLQRLIEQVNTECVRQGLLEVRIDRIENLDSLLNRTLQPCIVTVLTPTNLKLEIHIFHDGSKFVIVPKHQREP